MAEAAYHTRSDVCRILGLRHQQYMALCDHGIAVPARGGDGPGSYRLFSLMRVVGMLVAARLRAGPPGCSWSYAAAVADMWPALPRTSW
jgi:hypothetical protein